MAGHSKWSKVKHIKGVVDVKRGRVFSKLSREIIMAAKAGGGDPRLNARLRTAMDAARAQNMPNDTIERAIKNKRPCVIDVHVDANIRPPSTGTWQLPPIPYKEPIYGKPHVR